MACYRVNFTVTFTFTFTSCFSSRINYSLTDMNTVGQLRPEGIGLFSFFYNLIFDTGVQVFLADVTEVHIDMVQ